jgi:long-chain acyl-CoA synthetase
MARAPSTSATGKRAGGVAKGARTLVEMFQRRVERSRNRHALRHKAHGHWHPTTWGEWDRAAREIAGGLLDLGVQIGDRVALLAQTRLEWPLCDAGALLAGAIVVPIYPSSTPEQCEHILRDSGSSLVIAEDPHQLEKLLEIKSGLAQVQGVVLLAERAELDRADQQGRTAVNLADVLPPSSPGREWVVSMADLRQRGRALLDRSPGRLAEIAAALDPDQAATIIYTSGTTGQPKGVVLTHANLVFECAAVEELLGLGEEDEQLLFLPLAHSFARSVMWAAVAIGASSAIAESLAKVVPNLGETRPTFLTAVPRVLEKAYARIQANFEAKRKKPLTRRLIDWAIARGRERSARLRKGERANGLAIRLADRLVFAKVRDVFGGRLKFIVSGGAPLAPEIAEFFHLAGLTVLEGYGLTENCGAATCNRIEQVRFGSVGPPIPGVEVRIAEDGEILLRGGNVMKGYYNDPAATAAVLDGGWFHTGDVGHVDGEGHLRITDRKKDLIVTAGGKNVAPQNLENELKALCPLVSQVVVIGDRRKYLVALVTLNEETARDWAANGRLAGAASAAGDLAALSRHPAVVRAVQADLDRLNRKLPSYETIKRFAILPVDFSQESGELTPSLKVKRKVCIERYSAEIERLYRDEGSSEAKRPTSAEAPA